MGNEASSYDDSKSIIKGFAAGTINEDVILPCHLSPETSTESVTIRWLKETLKGTECIGTECIYLYEKGQVIKGRGYGDRLTLNTQELQKGNVSLTLSKYSETDNGLYICQVQHGEQEEETAVRLITQDLRTRRGDDDDDDDIRILVCGMSRAGIIATVNAILGYRAFKATSTSSTKVTGVVGNRKVSFIDTRGFLHMYDRERRGLCSRLVAPGPHVILHVIQKPTFQQIPNEKYWVEVVERLFATHLSQWPNSIFLFTHGGDSVEDPWKANPELQKGLSRRCRVFNTNDPSQVTELMKEIKLVKENGEICITKKLEFGMRIMFFHLNSTWQIFRNQFDEEARTQERQLDLTIKSKRELQNRLQEHTDQLEEIERRRKRELEEINAKQQETQLETITYGKQLQKLRHQLTEKEIRKSELDKIIETQKEKQLDMAKEYGEQLHKLKEKERRLREEMTTEFEEQLKEQNIKVEELTVQLIGREGRVSELEEIIKKKEVAQLELTREMEELKSELQTIKELEKIEPSQLNKVQQKEKESRLDKLVHKFIGNSAWLTKKTQEVNAEKTILDSIRLAFIARVSNPNLDSLLDELFDKKVINDREMEYARGVKDRDQKARTIIDMVRRKGNKKCSTMIGILAKLDELPE